MYEYVYQQLEVLRYSQLWDICPVGYLQPKGQKYFLWPFLPSPSHTVYIPVSKYLCTRIAAENNIL